MTIDVEAIRRETVGTADVAHLNSAGCSLPPDSVLETVVEWLQTEARVGGYELAADRSDQLNGVYQAAIDLFGGERHGWAFVESATRAWNAAVSSLRFQPGDRILTTRAEYPSNMGGLLRARDFDDVSIEIIPDDEHGQLDVVALATLLDERVRMVSVTHIPTQGGLINPVEEVGALLAGHDTLYVVDACQSAGQIPVNVEEIGCDVLSFTGRKFLRGPRGTGMVWASDRALARMGNPAGVDMQGAIWTDPLQIDPLPDAGRFEPYEIFFGGKVGLAAAMRYAAELGIDNIAVRNAMLSTRLRDGLDSLAGVQTHDLGANKSAIVTFTVDGHDSADVKTHLRANGVSTSTSGDGSARLDFPRRGLTSVVRASVHYFNTVEEIDRTLTLVADLAN